MSINFRVYLGVGLIILSGCKERVPPTCSDWHKDSLVTEILERVRHDYMEEPNEEKMKEGALDGMLKALDPYSSYFSPDAYKIFAESAQGEFGGIGLEVLMMEGVLRVISPIDDTPGARAGIMAGDIITHVDGKNLTDMTYVEILKALHGKPGSKVLLTLRRADQDPIQVSLERAIITINPVKYDSKNNVGVLRISYFNEKTEEKLKEAIQALKNNKSKPLQAAIVDLRNNPGGTLDQALAVTSLFLEGKKKIVEIRGRDPKKNHAYYSKGKDILDGIPMIVLINGGSASASEIFAGALKDHRRALLMGKTSVGKGSVQAIFPIQNRGAVKLTISRFYTPENHEIHNKGVIPDIVIEEQLPKEKPKLLEQKVIREDDNVLQQALGVLKALLVLK